MTKYGVYLSADVRTGGFILRHPVEASRIGKADIGADKTDYTNTAIRFSTNELGLKENEKLEGSQINAFRHTLWQASITEGLGFDIALEVGFAHEENPYLIDGIDDFRNIRFSSLEVADSAIDLLNNRIGREVGGSMNTDCIKDIAIAVLDYYHTHGLWVVREQSNIKFLIFQEKLSDEQYTKARARLDVLDAYGFAPDKVPW